MIYRSNLEAPDLSGNFRYLVSREMGHSFGHDVPSDWRDKDEADPVFGLYKNCGMWTQDEAAILYSVARKVKGNWVDVGSHSGWTAAHIIAGGATHVDMVDPLYADGRFVNRAVANMARYSGRWQLRAQTSAAFFDDPRVHAADGIVIDGDHEPDEPLKDAIAAAEHLSPFGVILFHDFVGLPVREAVRYLMTQCGMRCKLYLTPHVVACCWWSHSNPFTPPVHKFDVNLTFHDLPARWPEFDWRPYF